MITVENLVKEFGTKRAVNGVSFAVKKGEVLGFLGPNGAGKSTTMRMLTGYMTPTSGKVQIGGRDVSEDPIAAKKLVGYLPESAPCYSDMTVRGFLGFCAELRGLSGSARSDAISRVANLCFLDSVLHQSVDTLSKGYRHRTCLAQALIHDPEVLVLDEPTDGLDPNQKHEVRQLIKRMGQTKAIIFSTHILEEVEACCSRAMIIDRGVVVANGTPEQLKLRSKSAGSVVVRVSDGTAEMVRNKLALLALAGDVSVGTEGTSVSARVLPRDKNGGTELGRAIGELAVAERWRIEELHTEEGRMDDVFRSITTADTKKN